MYLGTSLQSYAAGSMLPTGPAAKDPAQWIGWPAFLIPFSMIGIALAARIWNELPAARRRADETAALPVAAPAAAGVASSGDGVEGGPAVA